MSDTFGSNIARDVIAQDAYGPIYSSQYTDAAKSARANEIGHRLGIPPDLVDANMPDMMAADRVQRAIANAKKNTAYARMMANPRLAASAIDDHHLPAVAKAVQAHTIDFGAINKESGGGIWGAMAQIGYGTGVLANRLASGVSDVFSGLSGTAHAFSEIADSNRLPNIMPSPTFNAIRAGMRLFGLSHSALTATAAATRYTTTNRNFNDVATGVEAIPTVATAALGPEVPVALFASQGMSEAYDEGRQAGLTPNRSGMYGVGNAAIMAGTSFLPEKYLGGVLSGQGGIAKTIVSAVGLNGVMTALTGLNRWYFIDKPRGVTFEQFVATLPDEERSSLVSTLATMGLTAGAGHVASRMAGHAVDSRSAQSLDGVMEAAAKSSTRTSNPSDFEAALNQLVGDSDASDLYVPADKVLELFQPQEGKAQRDLGSDPFWGKYAEQVNEAGSLGGDVVVPLSSAATHLAGSPDWAAIRDFVRTRPGGASRAEINVEHSPQDLEALASDIAKKLDEAVPQLKAQSLTSELASSLGYKGEQAQAVSQLLGAGLNRAYALEVARSEAAGRPARPCDRSDASAEPPRSIR